jgi:hypothetical protein
MYWLKNNAAAIQAIASIVGVMITAGLAAITYWYVRVTREIAKSSAEQTIQTKELAEIHQRERKEREQQSARTLWLVAQRSRSTLEATEFSFAGLRVFHQPTEEDLVDINSLPRQLNNTNILIFANRAIISLRAILAFVDRVKQKPVGIGWTPVPEETQYWTNAVEHAIKNLREIENQCKALVSSKEQPSVSEAA